MRKERRDALANTERVLAAAAAAVLREGPQVPLATVAADAGVGIATLYRRYPTREALLGALTHRAFLLIRDHATAAAERDEPARSSLDWFLDRVVERRDQLVLPLHGGPAEFGAETAAVQAQVHAAIGRILDRGRHRGELRPDVTVGDVVTFGAMLARPLAGVADWDGRARRQKRIFLDGLAAR